RGAPAAHRRPAVVRVAGQVQGVVSGGGVARAVADAVLAIAGRLRERQHAGEGPEDVAHAAVAGRGLALGAVALRTLVRVIALDALAGAVAHHTGALGAREVYGARREGRDTLGRADALQALVAVGRRRVVGVDDGDGVARVVASDRVTVAEGVPDRRTHGFEGEAA